MPKAPKSNPVNEFVRESIRRLRHQRGLGIRQLAERSGIPAGSYSCIETGRYRLNLENLYRILAALEADINDVWPWTPSSLTSLGGEQIERALRRAERRRPPQARLDDVLTAVCRCCHTTRREMASRSRAARISRARAVAAQIVSEQGQLSLTELARRLRRDVSSLSHHLRRFRRVLSEDAQADGLLRRTRRALERVLRERAG